MQPTCLVASDSCCSILSTIFLKGGLLKGSASQQDLMIWYLHISIQKHQQLIYSHYILFSSRVRTVLCSKSLLRVFLLFSYSREKPNATGWKRAAFQIPHIAFFCSLATSIYPNPLSFWWPFCTRWHFTSTSFTQTRISRQRKLTFQRVQSREHPFCILLLSVCRTWHPQAYRDKGCFLHSAEMLCYTMHFRKHTDR